MKKLLFLLAIILTTSAFAQEYYWTTYSFNVEPEDEEIVIKLANDYFSSPNSKADGVTVYLFENHFKDKILNSSHQIAFTGTLDAMGKLKLFHRLRVIVLYQLVNLEATHFKI